MRTVDDIVCDPVEFMPHRAELNLSEQGLTVIGADWGESAVDVAMADGVNGEEPIDYTPKNKTSVLKLAVREDAEADLPTAAFNLQAKVGLWHKHRGWLRRDFIYGNFAGSLACMVKAASLADFAGWQAGESPDVTLSLVTSLYWYATEEISAGEFSEAEARELQFVLADVLGTAPGHIRIRVTNDGATPWRALIPAIECEDYSSDPTAELAYDAVDLTPLGGAKAAEYGGVKVIEHTSLTAGWLPILGSEIAGVGHMTHRGARRPQFRVYDPGEVPGDVELRLEYRALGSLYWTPGPIVPTPLVDDWQILEMGEARILDAVLGEHRWEFRLAARARSGSGAVRVERCRILPTEQRLAVRAPSSTQDASSQSQKSPATVESTGAGTTAWTSATNAKASDGSYATAAGGIQSTKYLLAKNFAFAIPSTATITGIVAAIERSGSVSNTSDYVNDNHVYIVKGGAMQEGVDRKALGKWPAADAVQAYGSSSDLWGQAWTYSDINAEGFGVALQAYLVDATARVDHISITVYYTEAEDENRICFQERSIELRSDGVFRQHPEDDVWGRVVPEDGFYLEAPPALLEDRVARGIVIPSQGDLDQLPDTGSNPLSAEVFYRPAYLYAREALVEGS